MNLENWRNLNLLFQNIIIFSLILTSIFFLIKYNDGLRVFKPLLYYVVGVSLIESVSKYLIYNNIQTRYFEFVNYFYIPFEMFTLYWFIVNISKFDRKIKLLCISNFVLICFLFLSALIFPKFKINIFILPIVLNILVILVALYLQIKNKIIRKFINQPEIIILISFLVSNLVMIVAFFLMPYFISYSKILANQIMIIQHVITISFYTSIGYAISKVKTKTA